MISLTRRDFLQSAFASGLVLATQKIENARWLLSTRDQIKLGVVGLGRQVYEHLSILAAIPTVRIVTLGDPDMHRLQMAAGFLRGKGLEHIHLTTHLGKLISDPLIDAITVGCPFPSSFAPLPTLLAAKKPILFDSPAVSSYEDALCTSRTIAKSETILRSRLTDRFSPDSQNLCSPHPALRSIGTPLEASLVAPPFSTRPMHPYLPAAACLDVLLALSADSRDRFLLSCQKFLSEPHISRTRGSAIVEFKAPDSFLSRIRVDGLAVAPARQACLSLRGQSGLLTLRAGTEAHPDSAACTIIDFLTAIRFCPQSPSNAAQRTFLSVGLLQLIHDSGMKNRS